MECDIFLLIVSIIIGIIILFAIGLIEVGLFLYFIEEQDKKENNNGNL